MVAVDEERIEVTVDVASRRVYFNIDREYLLEMLKDAGSEPEDSNQSDLEFVRRAATAVQENPRAAQEILSRSAGSEARLIGLRYLTDDDLRALKSCPTLAITDEFVDEFKALLREEVCTDSDEYSGGAYLKLADSNHTLLMPDEQIGYCPGLRIVTKPDGSNEVQIFSHGDRTNSIHVRGPVDLSDTAAAARTAYAVWIATG
ncbi:Uncharacterised protein [Mycobacteroides abscessus subsp. abscessus]|jgi:hypothetical protein|uniref:hypothetical protein n=1 Tax=Mycobacteroides abscessus TaxID=36809 RepID=UPI00092B5C2D|nr:hypothetical protein [Mycobacteroides abscessus]SIH22430.1 Uncharacterised protein [Mycobacteroides abscessus subsp. abscessus]